MLIPYRFASIALGFALIATAGCGGDDEPKNPDECAAGHDHAAAGHDHCADPGDGGEDEDDVVPCSAAYPAFREGLTARAGDLTVRLVSVNPEPVRQKQDNTWVLEVVDADGAPVADAAIVEPDTWMDVHNHGGRWEPDVAKGDAPGQFELTKIDFKMPGPWRLRFGVKASASAAIERSTFQICVE